MGNEGDPKRKGFTKRARQAIKKGEDSQPVQDIRDVILESRRSYMETLSAKDQRRIELVANAFMLGIEGLDIEIGLTAQTCVRDDAEGAKTTIFLNLVSNTNAGEGRDIAEDAEMVLNDKVGLLYRNPPKGEEIAIVSSKPQPHQTELSIAGGQTHRDIVIRFPVISGSISDHLRNEANEGNSALLGRYEPYYTSSSPNSSSHEIYHGQNQVITEQV